MPSHVRLDPSDAELVDVIHTDGKGIFFLGMSKKRNCFLYMAYYSPFTPYFRINVLRFLGYGMSQPCGHLDFYPNDGKEQPGCDITQTPLVPLTLIR